MADFCRFPPLDRPALSDDSPGMSIDPPTTIHPRFTGKGDLTAGPVQDHLIRLSVPMIWGILSIVSFQLVDTFYISLLGTHQLAAIGFTFPVTMTIFSLIIGLGIGMSSVLARRIGAGDYAAVTRLATHGIFVAALTGAALGVIGIMTMNPIFRAMGADDTMMQVIDDYMVLWFAGCAFIAVPVVGNSAIRATGDTLSPSITMMTAAGINAALAPFFVFGIGPFPRMEVQGAALATLLSYMIALAVGMYILYARKKLIFQGPLQLDRLWESTKQILHVGLPAGMGSLIQPLTQGVLTGILAAYGTEAVAAFGVATRIEAFAFVIIMALATGMSPILGQNMGAGRMERVQETLKLSLGFCIGWSVFVAAALGLLAGPIARVFSTDAVVVHGVMLYFWIVPFSYAASNLVQGWASAFNAMGQPKKAAIMIVVKMLVLQIPLALICGHLWGAPGVFASIAAVNIVTGIYFHTRHWAALFPRPAQTT